MGPVRDLRIRVETTRCSPKRLSDHSQNVTGRGTESVARTPLGEAPRGGIRSRAVYIVFPFRFVFAARATTSPSRSLVPRRRSPRFAPSRGRRARGVRTLIIPTGRGAAPLWRRNRRTERVDRVDGRPRDRGVHGIVSSRPPPTRLLLLRGISLCDPATSLITIFREKGSRAFNKHVVRPGTATTAATRGAPRTMGARCSRARPPYRSRPPSSRRR